MEPQVAIPQSKATLPSPEAGSLPPHGGRRKTGGTADRSNIVLLKIIVGWSLLLAGIILGARFLWTEQKTVPITDHPADPGEIQTDQEDEALLQKAAPLCTETLHHYLGAATLEEKNQFVLSPAKTATRMVRFYRSNPIERVDPAELTLTRRQLIKLPDGKAIETLWSIRDSRKIEVMFRQEGDVWKLDWNHFVRYSDHPWALFLAGSGEPEGEFRLLVRERLAKERKDEQDISIILYAPRFGDPGETGYQSPEFNVSRNSEEGRLLDAAFRQKREGRSAYQSTLSSLDPDEMIRVRVRVRRTETDDVRKFIITRVIACHWHENDDTGITMATQEPDKTPDSE